MLVRLTAAILLLSVVAVSARPPPGSDPTSPTAQWFERQKNMRGGSCCGLGDGHRLEDNQWRIVTTGNVSHYEVLIGAVWYPIEDWQTRKDLEGDPNPTGAAVVWYSYNSVEGGAGGVMIYCFAPGTSF